MEINFIIIIGILILAILQTIVGVGILLLGTPFLLIQNFNILDTISLLVPISIFTSFSNLIIFNYLNNYKFEINTDTKSLFFKICIPSIFIGFFFLSKLQEIINFKYFVSIIMILSIMVTHNKNFVDMMSNKLKTIFLFLIGIIHGMTNSGGTLLSIFMKMHLNKNNARYNITYFYLFLALFQFIIFLIFFDLNIEIKSYFQILVFVPLSILIGNYLVKYIYEQRFKVLIEILGLFACTILLIK